MLTTTPANPITSDVDYVGEEQGLELLDRQSMKQLGIPAKVFIERYRTGNLAGLNRADVFDVAMLLPFVGESLNGQTKP